MWLSVNPFEIEEIKSFLLFVIWFSIRNIDALIISAYCKGELSWTK